MPWDRRVRDVRDIVDCLRRNQNVNLTDAAVLAGYDHFVVKCAHFVERNRAVVRIGAAAETLRDKSANSVKIPLTDGLFL